MSCFISFVWASPSCEQQEVSEKFKMKIYASTGNWTSHHFLSKGYKPYRIQYHKATLTSMEGRVYRLYLIRYNHIRPTYTSIKGNFSGLYDRMHISMMKFTGYTITAVGHWNYLTCEVRNWLEHGLFPQCISLIVSLIVKKHLWFKDPSVFKICWKCLTMRCFLK